jgi:predicted O-linked N-acetylglucosamine transferase (SPINDLY family)
MKAVARDTLAASERSCRAALAASPDNIDALRMLADIQLSTGRAEEAVVSLRHLSHSLPDSASVQRQLGNALMAVDAANEAERCYRRAIALEPDNPRGHNNLGQALARQSLIEPAVRSFQTAIALDGRYAIAYSNLAAALFADARIQDALASARTAVTLDGSLAEAHVICGNALRRLKRVQEALDCVDRALALKPQMVDALVARGNVLQQLRRLDEALAAYRRALQLQPGHGAAACNEAGTLLDMGRTPEALACCDRHINENTGRDDAQRAALHNVRAGALRALGRHEEAALGFSRVRELDPNFELALGRMLYAKQCCCDWSDFERHVAELQQAILAGMKAANPFAILSLCGSAPLQLRCAGIFARDDTGSPMVERARARTRGPHRPLRVAYLSGDLGEHPVSYLMVGVFEQHDRRQVESVAVSLRPPEASAMGQRVRAAVDSFIDASASSDADVAALLRDLHVDIVVDLVGFTQSVRLGILAQRPAPVQVNYLGYPGTMGASYIDYILADGFVVPEASRCHYAEQVVYLPECFQANDDRRLIGHRPGREQAGLPESGFVFCSFNSNHKITPAIFDIWCRLLRHIPGSVLWLVAESDASRRNLQREARVRGVADEHLVFAERTTYAQHLGRFGLADLFLDTVPFNAGTTASDALWSGVPVLTCAGEAFAGRMAGSLLHTIGLPELVTHSLLDYEALALELASHPQRLEQIRSALAGLRGTSPLFQTERFCRHLERAYAGMWRRVEEGAAPESFAVEPLPAPIAAAELRSRAMP